MIFNKLKQNGLIKVLSVNSLSVAISFVLGIASTKIVSFFLGAAGMAILGSFRNLTGMLKSITSLGANGSLIKLYVENKNDKKELSIVFSTFFWCFLFVTLFTGILTSLFAKTIAQFLFFDASFVNSIRVFSLLLPFITLNVFWLALYNGLEKINRIVMIQILSNLIIFCFTALLIWRNNIEGGVFSFVLGELIIFLATYFFIKKDKAFFKFELKPIIDKKYLKVILNFSFMAFLSALLVPVVLILIRNYIVETNSIDEAGLWDATNKLSFFYMSVFNSGLSLYYLPKLTSLQTDSEFKTELKFYFKVFIPLFILMLLAVFLFSDIILSIAFTKEFVEIKEVLIWQLLGDLVKVMTLAFGYQILVKSRVKEYLIIEVVFNFAYLTLSYYLVSVFSFQGAIKAYFYASLITFAVILFMFRRLLKN